MTFSASVDYSVLISYDYNIYTPFFNIEFYCVEKREGVRHVMSTTLTLVRGLPPSSPSL